MKTKIKVTDILAAAGKQGSATVLGKYGTEVFHLVNLEALKGHGYDQEVTAFFVRVASNHRGNRIHSAFQQRVEGENWRTELVATLEVARHEAEKFTTDLRARHEKRLQVEAARIEYAVQLGEMIGRTVYVHRVNTDESGPVGITFQITLKGTSEEVAEKYQRVLALADEYTRNRTQV